MTYLSDRFWRREYLTAKKHTINSALVELMGTNRLGTFCRFPLRLECFEECREGGGSNLIIHGKAMFARVYNVEVIQA